MATDAESDGIPTPAADGDDNDNTADEDGVAFGGPLSSGTTEVITVTAVSGGVAMRFRVTDDAGQGGDSPTGQASSGEIEDYFPEVQGAAPTVSDETGYVGASVTMDFGDLPAPYPTLLADDGARHLPDGVT